MIFLDLYSVFLNPKTQRELYNLENCDLTLKYTDPRRPRFIILQGNTFGMVTHNEGGSVKVSNLWIDQGHPYTCALGI